MKEIKDICSANEGKVGAKTFMLLTEQKRDGRQGKGTIPIELRRCPAGVRLTRH